MNSLEALDPSRTGHRAPVRERTNPDAADRGVFASLIDRSRGAETRDASPNGRGLGESDMSIEGKNAPEDVASSISASSDRDAANAEGPASAKADAQSGSAAIVSTESKIAVESTLSDPSDLPEGGASIPDMSETNGVAPEAAMVGVTATYAASSDLAPKAAWTMSTSIGPSASTPEASMKVQADPVETPTPSEPLVDGEIPSSSDLAGALATSARDPVVSDAQKAPTDVSGHSPAAIDMGAHEKGVAQEMATPVSSETPVSPADAKASSAVSSVSAGPSSPQAMISRIGSETTQSAQAVGAPEAENPDAFVSGTSPEQAPETSPQAVSIETAAPDGAAIPKAPSRILSAIPPVSQGSGYGARGREFPPSQRNVGGLSQQGRVAESPLAPMGTSPVISGSSRNAMASPVELPPQDVDAGIADISSLASDRRPLGAMETSVAALANRAAAATAAASITGGMKAVLLEGSSPRASLDTLSPGLPIEAGQGRIESFEAKVEALRAPTPRPELAQSALRQLAQVQLSDGETRIALTPKGMGEILIELRTDEAGRLQAVLRAENPAVLQALRSERDALLSSLSQAGAKLDDAGLNFGDFPGGGRGFGRQSDPDASPRGASAGWDLDAVEVSADPKPSPHRASLTGRLDILT
jgi:hypothetical protein